MSPAPVRAPSRLDPRTRDRRRPWLWALLVLLLAVAQTLLVLMTQAYEDSRRQQHTHEQSAEVAARVHQLSNRDVQALQGLLWTTTDRRRWRDEAVEQLRRFRSLLRVESRDADSRLQEAVSSPYRAPVFLDEQRGQFQADTDLACAAALRRQGNPQYSRSYFVPRGDGEGGEVVDVCQARMEGGVVRSYLVATLSLAALLDEALTPEQAHGYEFSFVDGDGSRLARAGLVRGRGVYRSERLIELPGLSLMLRVDSSAGPPGLIPSLSTALVLGLSLALLAVVVLLARDGRRRALAERRLAQSLAFRQAMENSLMAGLRARDMDGNITYVNKAFCAIVGYEPRELLGQDKPPYWPPEFVETYRQRLRERNALVAENERRGLGESESWRSFETVYLRASGERFPVMIYEAPLRDADGSQTGWMSAVLDITEQQRMEEFSRAQADRLQASARLAAVGEMASLISHEINQPLAAIASYAAAARNLLADGHEDAQSQEMLRRTAERIAEQAERAGRVIKSVHDFVRRRERAHEIVPAAELIEAVLPLVRMQARKGGIRISVEVPDPSPAVHCDRTLVEQVLLNLARNAIQAMEGGTPPGQRQLVLGVSMATPRWVVFTVTDSGPGIPPEVGRKLFTPFFTTRTEGMGLGLSLCRTVVEQHGGAMDFRSHDLGQASGCEFRFTLPATTGGNAP
ncbi:MAG: PAS domain S-box protein [Paucibacter sp.]|nr:PAS domain S-box protein [Roseateles sp.]